MKKKKITNVLSIEKHGSVHLHFYFTKKQLWFLCFTIRSTFPSSLPLKINVDSLWIGAHVFIMYVSLVYFNSKCESHLKSHLVIIWKSICYETNKQINKSVCSAGQLMLRRGAGGLYETKIHLRCGSSSRGKSAWRISVTCLRLWAAFM